MSAVNNDRRQRIRDQIKHFYGDPNAAGGSAAGRRSQDGARRNPGVPPEMDLDSEYFNVMKYTTDLLRRESLKGLVESDTELLRSVRRLDGELQELVYRNYAKFISATDTIREMRQNVAQMDAKLQTLSSNVASIDEVSKEISAKLQEHHGRVESTITTNRMLKKIQFLVELPATMRRMLDKQAYSVCVKYWVAGDGFLAKHAAIASIAKIQSDCRALARELYTTMEQAMCAVCLDDPEAMDGIRSYVESLRLLRATSLYSQEERRQDEDSATFEEGILKVLMDSVSANFASGVAAAQRGMKTALAVPPNLASLDLAQRVESLSHVGLREALAQLKSSCALLSVNSERVYTLLNRLDSSKVVMRVTQEVQPVLINLLAPAVEQLGELAVAVLGSIVDEGLIALHAPDAISTALQSAVAALVKQLKHLAVTLKTLGANYLNTALSRQSASYAAMVESAVGDILRRVAGALADRAWQQPDPTAVQAMAGTYALFEKTRPTSTLALATAASAAAAEAPAAAAGLSVAGPPGLPWPLTGERVLRTAYAVSRWVGAGAANLLAAECAAQLVHGEALPQDRASACLGELHTAAAQLLHRGVLLVGQLQVAAVAPAAVGNTAGAVDPSLPVAQGGGVSPTLTALVRGEWARLHALLEALPPPLPTDPATAAALLAKVGASLGTESLPGMLALPTGGAGGPAGLYAGRMFAPSSTGRSSGPRSVTGGGRGGAGGGAGRPVLTYTRRRGGGLQSSVDRVFSGGGGGTALHTLPRDGRPATVMGGLVLYVLAGLVDHVRAAGRVRVYDQSTFQRVQVSGSYLLRSLLSPGKGTVPRQWLKVWDDDMQRDVQQLLDEACCCAYERYEAKVPLSNAALEKIMEEALAADPAALSPRSTAGVGGNSAHAYAATTSASANAAPATEADHAAPPSTPQPPSSTHTPPPPRPPSPPRVEPPPKPKPEPKPEPKAPVQQQQQQQQQPRPTPAVEPPPAPKPSTPTPLPTPAMPTQAPAAKTAAPGGAPPQPAAAPRPLPQQQPQQQQPRPAPDPRPAAPRPPQPSAPDTFRRVHDDEELPM